MAGAIDGAEVARLAKLAQSAGRQAGTASALVRHDERSLGIVTDVLLNRAGRAETKFTKASTAASSLADGLTAAGATHLAVAADDIAGAAKGAAVDARTVGFTGPATGGQRLAQLVRDGRVAGAADGLAASLRAVRRAGTTIADGAALDAAVAGARASDGTLPGAGSALHDAAHAADLARSATHAQPVQARRLLAEGVRDYATAWARVDGDATLAGRATPEAVAAIVAGTFADHRAVPIAARRVREAAAELHAALPAAGPRASADPALVLQDHAWSAARAMNDSLLAHTASSRRGTPSRAQALTYDVMAPLANDATAAKATLAKGSPAWDGVSALTLAGPDFPVRAPGETVFETAGYDNLVGNAVASLGSVRPTVAPDATLSSADQVAVLDRAKAHVAKARTLWRESGEAEFPTGSTDITGTKGRFGRTYRSWKYIAREGFTTSVHKVGEAGSELLAARRLLATVVDEDVAGTGKLFESAMSTSASHVATATNATLNLDTMGNSWRTKHALETAFPKHEDYGRMEATLNGLGGVIDLLHGGAVEQAAADAAFHPVTAVVPDAAPVVTAGTAAAADTATAAAKDVDEAVLGF